MDFLNKTISSIKPSQTLALTAKAKELSANGKDIVNFAGGEPDFNTPEWVCDSAKKAIDEGKTRYTAASGTISLKEAVCKKLLRENNLSYKKSEVTIGNGAKQLIYNALNVTLNHGDEVIIPSPYWVSYPDMVTIAGGVPVIVNCDIEDNFLLTPEKLEKSITEKTKWIILNSPSNPTGSIYTKEHLEKISNVLKNYPNVHILSDDIYEHIIYEGEFFNMPMVDELMKDRTLIINGVSKSYAMTGWRIGFAAGNESLIKAMNILQSQSTSNACSIAQEAAESALNGPQDFLNDWKNSYKDRRDTMMSLLNKIDGLHVSPPNGAFYLFIDITGLIGKKTISGKTLNTDLDIADYFIDQAGVVGVPGSAFGSEKYLRFSYATSKEEIIKGIKKVSDSVLLLK